MALVRDPRDVVSSWLESPPHFGGAAHAAEVWAVEQGEALRAYSLLGPAGRMRLLRYEDLVRAPEEALEDWRNFITALDQKEVTKAAMIISSHIFRFGKILEDLDPDKSG